MFEFFVADHRFIVYDDDTIYRSIDHLFENQHYSYAKVRDDTYRISKISPVTNVILNDIVLRFASCELIDADIRPTVIYADIRPTVILRLCYAGEYVKYINIGDDYVSYGSRRVPLINYTEKFWYDY